MAAALERALGPAGPGSVPALPPLPVLVLGPAGSGRTSLLLRAALAGGADGPRALFVAPDAIPRLPAGAGGAGADPRALQRLHLHYPSSRRSLLLSLLSQLHLSPHPPALLLLDGLERFLGGSAASAARLAALLLQLTRHAAAVTAVTAAVPRRPPQLVAALRLPPAGPRVLAALLRFFPARCHLRAEGGAGRVTLRCPGMAARRWRVSLGTDGHGGDGHGDSGDSGDGLGDSPRDSPGHGGDRHGDSGDSPGDSPGHGRDSPGHGRDSDEDSEDSEEWE